MTLTRWPRQQDIDFADLCHRLRLLGIGRTADQAAEESGHVLTCHGGTGKVKFEDVSGVGIQVNGGGDLDPATNPPRGFGEANTEASPAAEKIDHSHLRRACFIIWPTYRLDEFGVRRTN